MRAGFRLYGRGPGLAWPNEYGEDSWDGTERVPPGPEGWLHPAPAPKQAARPSGLAPDGLLPEISAVKILRGLLFVAVALCFACTPALQAELSWQTDYKKAQEQAKADKKLLLVDFTGSDWCGWCIRLNREVFSKAEFQEYASKNLVLVEIDFPRSKAQSDALKKQNEQLAMQYQIQGFPTLVVLNSEGRVVGELGYMQGGPSAFIAELEKLRKG